MNPFSSFDVTPARVKAPEKESRCYTCDRALHPHEWRYEVVPKQLVCAPCCVLLDIDTSRRR